MLEFSLDGRAPRCAQATRELYVFLLYGDAAGVDGAQIGVVEEVHEEGFGGFLQRHDGLALPAVGAVFARHGLCDFADLRMQS